MYKYLVINLVTTIELKEEMVKLGEVGFQL